MMQSKEQGFTLIELVAVILIVALLSSLATYSSRVLFDGNIRSYASQFATVVREIKNNTLVSSEGGWTIRLGKQSENYYWEVWKDSNRVQICKLPKNVEVYKNDILISNSIEDVEFYPSTGKVKSGYGDYLFKSTITGKEIHVQIIKNTGGVLVDD